MRPPSTGESSNIDTGERVAQPDTSANFSDALEKVKPRLLMPPPSNDARCGPTRSAPNAAICCAAEQ